MGNKKVLRGWETTQIQDNVVKMGQSNGKVDASWSGDTMLQSHQQWQLPIMLSILICGLAVFVAVIIWLRNQMSSTSSSCSDKVEAGEERETQVSTEGGQWICHPVIKPVTTEQCETVPGKRQGVRTILPEVMTGPPLAREPVRIKAKGLLERRGSSASLTIDLLNPSQENLSVTPTRECTAEEYLLSVGNVLSRSQLRQCLKDTSALHKEFWDLPLNYPEPPDIPGSAAKNRYRSVVPNEKSRVYLPSDSFADPSASYINANYIRGYDGEEKAFIATQGPLANTVGDFWRMVWHECCPVIVMFTRLMDDSRAKCEPYFPMEAGAAETYSGILVTIIAVTVKDGYVIRHIELEKDEEVHRVTHFWFDSWPDHKTPNNTHSLLCLVKDVEYHRFKDVHRGSLSSWPLSPKPTKTEFTDLLSPCPEATSPPSLKEISPDLHFGRLELTDEEVEKGLSTSPKSDRADNQMLLKESDLLQSSTEETEFNISTNLEKSIFQVIPHIPAEKCCNKSCSNDDVFKASSPSQKNSTRVTLESLHSRSEEISILNGTQKLEDQNIGSKEVFDFNKLILTTEEASSLSDESTSSGGRKKLSSVTSEYLRDSFEKKLGRGKPSSSSPIWTSDASPNLTQSTSKLSVDSLSWGGLESPLTSSDSASRRGPHSSTSDSSKQWLPSSEDSPRWPHTPSRLDKSPLFSKRSREGSVTRGVAAGPVVVHCSAGIGRTGCFIAICVGVSQLLGENNVDILGIVCRLRYDRGGMVQSAEQYEFIHRALTLFERSLPDQSGE